MKDYVQQMLQKGRYVPVLGRLYQTELGYKKDNYSLPRIDDTLQTLSGSHFFTILDLVSVYWQVDLDTSDKEKSAFVTPQGLFEFNVMLFDMCGAPSTFQRLMAAVLAGLQWEICLAYLDDVITSSHFIKEHVERLKTIFQRFR